MQAPSPAPTHAPPAPALALAALCPDCLGNPRRARSCGRCAGTGKVCLECQGDRWVRIPTRVGNRIERCRRCH